MSKKKAAKGKAVGSNPPSNGNDIDMSRHSGMDRRNPDCREADSLRHPWSLGSGAPPAIPDRGRLCRNDEENHHTSALPVAVKTGLDWFWGKAWQLVAGGGLVVFIIGVVGWRNYDKQYLEKLQKGQDSLNMGLYEQAKKDYQEAIKLHPLRHVMLLGKFFGDPADVVAQQTPDLLGMDKEAQWGLKIASAFDSADPQQIEISLRQLPKDKQKDADIKTLLGKVHTAQAVQTQPMDFSQAEQDYQAALADKEQQNAEAHYGLGYVRWLQGRLIDALDQYQQAYDLSQKTSPRYAISLAGLFAEQKKYSEALDLYHYNGSNRKYPIAALESALVYRLQGKFKESQEWLNTALILLDDPEAKTKPENQTPWQFKTKTALISLSKPDDKRYYVYVTLAASQFLNDDKPNAKASLAKAKGLSEAHPVGIKGLIDYDLNRLVEERPALADKIKAFKAELR